MTEAGVIKSAVEIFSNGSALLEVVLGWQVLNTGLLWRLERRLRVAEVRHELHIKNGECSGCQK